ncbi:transglycosylase domain-containing protein [Actinocatenispora sera]|uniref:transglycosylase domain-containing protein n=1 Tax=Actinocatenispora sera TaxID=390989 RepID=UPI0006917CD7|nr:transglycosylase domain-containing protein [Actinocatenispora sera]
MVDSPAPLVRRVLHAITGRRGRRRRPVGRYIRWFRRALAGFSAVVLAAGLVLVGWAISLPLPADPAQPQQSVLYYSDGRTVLARVGVVDRIAVPLSRVPVPVRRAVLAAEDRSFYTHGAVSGRGIGRALWSDVTGDGVEGASTITQQYVRNAYLTLDRTVSRKVREIVLAEKLERRYSKDQILGRYLNTIYFGRGAYGIDAAARAYFGVPVDELDTAQGMVLATVIKDPTNFDPAVDPAGARNRWRYVRAGMVSQHWLGVNEAARLRFPATTAPAGTGPVGPAGLIAQQVEWELERHGITAQQLRTGGLRVVTTIDRATQQRTETAVRQEAPAGLAVAVVSVDPRTGGIRAYHGNAKGFGYFDHADAPATPGAAFTPLVLASAFQHGLDRDRLWDGRSPQQFPDRNGVPLYNPGNAQCPRCTIDDAVAHSYGTVLYRVAQATDPVRIVHDVRAAGVAASYAGRPSLVDGPDDPQPALTRPAIALGEYPVSPADLASGYATLGNDGRALARHVVDSVRSSAGGTLYRAAPAGRRAFTAAAVQQTRDVTGRYPTTLANGQAPERVLYRTSVQQQGKRVRSGWAAGVDRGQATVVLVAAGGGRSPASDLAGRLWARIQPGSAPVAPSPPAASAAP